MKEKKMKSQNEKKSERNNARLGAWRSPGLPPLSVRSLVILRAEFLFPSELFFRTGIQPSRVPTTYLLSQNIVGDQ